MSFARKFSVTFIANIIIIILVVLNNILVVRICGASGLGLFTLVITSVTILMTIAGGGAVLEANRYLAKNNKETAFNLFFNSLILVFAVSVLFFVWWAVFGGYPLAYTIKESLLFFVFLAVPFLFIQESNRGILWGLDSIDKYNLLSIFRSLFLLVSNLLLLFFMREGVETAIKSWVFTLVLGAAVSFLFLPGSKTLKFNIDKELFAKSFLIGWRTFFISILALLYTRVDIYFVQYFLGGSAVGYYSIVILIAAMANISPMIAGMLVFNKAVVKENNSVQDTAKLNRICVAYSLVVSMILFILGKYIIILLYGPEFSVSYRCLIFYIPALVASNLVSVVSMFTCGKEGFPIFNIVSLFIALGVSIVMNLILIPRLGINGSAIAASVAIGLRAILDIFYFKLRTKLTLYELFILKRTDINDFLNRFSLRLG